MTENYEHYISRNIKAYYKKRLFSPIIYILLLLLLWIPFPFRELLFPKELAADRTISNTYHDGDMYVSANLTDLTFTGYTGKTRSNTKGYYYYTMWNDQCIVVLLAPSTCDQGLPHIEELQLRAKIVKGNDSYSELLTQLAKDLEWTTDGIVRQMPSFYLSEPDTFPTLTTFMFFLYFASLTYAVFSLILYLVYMRFPFLSPPCQDLAVFGNPKRMLEEAEEELLTLPQLATEDMFITEHYFILTSPYGTSLIPIKEILWIYKYSTLHKILWYHFNISYTLHITANRYLYVRCPKNIKSDIDGIIDYLSEANHDILVGFSEENRIKVQAKLGKPFHLEKFYTLLRKRL